MKTKYLMIVDDASDTREYLTILFENEGISVVTAENGLDALKKLRALVDKPCMILLDLMMPIMDGPQFRAEQLKDASIANIPVVVLSGWDDAKDHIDADEYVLKPVDIDVMVQLAEKYCLKP